MLVLLVTLERLVSLTSVLTHFWDELIYATLKEITRFLRGDL